MKILIAPDKYKDALDAWGVAKAAATGVQQACPSAEIVGDELSPLPWAPADETLTRTVVPVCRSWTKTSH